jgi:hypothetical protein
LSCVIVGISTGSLERNSNALQNGCYRPPKITPATVAEFEAKAPGLSGLVKIPLILWPEDAKDAAEVMANEALPRLRICE